MSDPYGLCGESAGGDRTVLTIYTVSTDYYSSYGIIACELARHLDRQGHPVQVWTYDASPVRDNQPEDVQAIMALPFEPVWGGVLLAYPTMFRLYGPLAMSGPRLALTMFESTVLPEGWTRELNACDWVLTSTRWGKQLFRNNGVTTPIIVNPEGINEAFTYRPREDGRPFTFLCLGDRGMRKGWDLACKAFVRAFGTRQDVRMIIKTRRQDNIKQVSNPNIDLVCQDMTNEELCDLYASADVMVFPTRGEGFGLPPREFAATGGIAIVTHWSGAAEDIEQWGMPLERYMMEPAWADHAGFRGLGEWARPDVDEIADLMHRVVNLPLDARNEIGRKYAENARALYDWDRYAETMWAAWEEALWEKECVSWISI